MIEIQHQKKHILNLPCKLYTKRTVQWFSENNKNTVQIEYL